MAQKPKSSADSDGEPGGSPADKARRGNPIAAVALGLAALAAAGAIGFSLLRGGGDSAAAGNNAAAAAAPAQPSLATAIAELRQRIAQDPDNHAAWASLGALLKQDGSFAESRQAFQRAMQLKPDDADYVASYAEMILVDGGAAAEAEAVRLLNRTLELRRDHPVPRYYLAILKDKDGKHAEALDELIALLRDAPPGAPWESQVRDATEKIARDNNIDIAARLPARRASPATAGIPGPTREQLDAARAIPPAQQDEMAKGMVDRLDARLRQNPRDERGWMMLMRSRMVQGEAQGAAAALRAGLAAFGDDQAVQQRLRQAAAELGIPPA